MVIMIERVVTPSLIMIILSTYLCVYCIRMRFGVLELQNTRIAYDIKPALVH